MLIGGGRGETEVEENPGGGRGGDEEAMEVPQGAHAMPFRVRGRAPEDDEDEGEDDKEEEEERGRRLGRGSL